jgi:hypothetical protein
MVSLAKFFNKLNTTAGAGRRKPDGRQGSTTSRDDESSQATSDWTADGDDFSDGDTLCAVAPPDDNDPLAEWRRSRWQPGDKEMHARLLKRLDKMQKQAINQRGEGAIEAAREYFAHDSEAVASLPEVPSDRARETLAACVADAFCMWSCDRADIDNGRGVQDWQLGYYRTFRRPSKLYGSPVVPVSGNRQVRQPFHSTPAEHL